jgi:vitamin B12 transport system substrate-binding protein
VQEPQRIVSLSPDVSRILLDLGVAGQIVAADSASYEILDSSDFLDLGALEPTAAELVLQLDPDVTIGLADRRSRDFAKNLEALGIVVTLLTPRDANQADAAMLRIGVMVRREIRAQMLSAHNARDVAQISTRRDGRSRLHVAFVIGCDPLVVAGGAGLVHEILELSGADNVFHDEGFDRRTVSQVDLAERAPEVVLDATGRDAGSRCFDATPWRARVRSVPMELATLPSLDLLARVREVHAILYSRESQLDPERADQLTTTEGSGI